MVKIKDDWMSDIIQENYNMITRWNNFFLVCVNTIYLLLCHTQKQVAYEITIFKYQQITVETEVDMYVHN